VCQQLDILKQSQFSTIIHKKTSQADHRKEANKPLFLIQAGLYTTKSGAFDKDTKSREHNKKTPKSLENSKKHCNFAK